MTQVINTASSMEYEKHNAVFVINDMTSLRYAIPFIKYAKKLLGITVKLAFNEELNTAKYNSIKKWKFQLDEIIKQNNISVINPTTSLIVKNLFCVENVITFKYTADSVYSFQHGFDYTACHKKINDCTYLVTEQYFSQQLQSLGTKAIVQPHPVTLWDFTDTVKLAKKMSVLKDKVVTMFYPESGLHGIFKQIYHIIDKLGYEIYVKQRAKNQAVPNYIKNVVYDSSWYPSESILYPMISDFCVGFGTSAYTDLVHLNRQFIDLSIPQYSKTYYKPKLQTFNCIMSDYLEKFYTLTPLDITVADKSTQQFDDASVGQFLEKILI